jgi:hypothetical protein
MAIYSRHRFGITNRVRPLMNAQCVWCCDFCYMVQVRLLREERE